MKSSPTPFATLNSFEELDLGIKSKSKRKRVISLLLFLMQHKGSYVSKRRMSAYIGVTNRSLFRYLRELNAIIPLDKKSGMYGLGHAA